jgi:hypothetical protein
MSFQAKTLQLKRSNAAIAAQTSPSALRNRSFSSPRATPMSPSAALPAATHAKPSARETPALVAATVTTASARCSRRPVQIAVRLPRFPSNRATEDPFTVVIATVKSEPPDSRFEPDGTGWSSQPVPFLLQLPPPYSLVC